MLRTALRPAFVAATVVWALLLPLVPFLASRPHASPLATSLLIAAYAIGSTVCHQLPERSYHLWTAQMPVCARCTGIYVGAAMAAILASVARGVPASARSEIPRAMARLAEAPEARRRQPRGRGPERAAPPKPDMMRAILVAAALPTLATLVYEWTTGHMPAHSVRAAAGAPLGATVAWLVLSSMPRRARMENQVN